MWFGSDFGPTYCFHNELCLEQMQKLAILSDVIDIPYIWCDDYLK